MNNKCHCYHKQPKTRYTYHPITGSPIGNDIVVGVCWGTKETEECSCGGDETKCDFYPKVRAEAKKKAKKSVTIKDAIEHYKYGISHDIFSEPVTTYAEMAVEALGKQIPKEPVITADGYWNGIPAYDIWACPNCGKCYEIDFDDFDCCTDCGQKIQWNEE